MARQFYYIAIDLTVKLNDKDFVSTDSVFDQVSVRLSDAAHRDKHKNMSFLKDTNFR